MKHFQLNKINLKGCQIETLAMTLTQMNMLYFWYLSLNSPGPHTVLHLKRQYLTVSWSGGKFHSDTCMPDVCCSHAPYYSTCDIYHKLLSSLAWEVESSESIRTLKHFFSLLFYHVIHMFSVFSLILVLHSSAYSKFTNHVFFPCLLRIRD
jgi:hypothetical protein